MTLRAVTVVGLGLIGGSVLRSLARAGLTARGYDADPATRDAARRAGTRWHIGDSLPDVVRGADLVLLAVPLPVLPRVLDDLAGGELAGYDGLLTDTTSAKQPVRRLINARRPAGRFVGGHPMAGRERAGFAAGDETLFDDRPWVLCLEPETPMTDWLALADLVTRLGARVVPATTAEHDAAVARVSHLPNLTAAALA
ncbi:MAG: prephenate dehydrogenase/arogenate dehydrogenase family protein, partial [Actinocatenispora sp.]